MNTESTDPNKTNQLPTMPSINSPEEQANQTPIDPTNEAPLQPEAVASEQASAEAFSTIPETPAADQSNDAFLQRARDLINELKAVVADGNRFTLEAVKTALASDEGRAFLIEILAANPDFRNALQQPPAQPAVDFSSLLVEISTTQGGPEWMPARLYSDNDPVYPSALHTYGNGPDGMQATTFLPEIETRIREAVAANDSVKDDGSIFYVSIRRPNEEQPKAD